MAELTPFQVVAEKMVELGFYDFFFPFMFVSVITFALLRKSKVLGDSTAISAVVALSVGFMAFGFPVLTGLTFGTELSTFFVQSTVFIIVLIMGVVIASSFYPDLNKLLMDRFKSTSFLYGMLALAIGIFVISGLLTVFINVFNPSATGNEPEVPGPPADIVIIVAALVIFMVMIVIAASIYRKSTGS